MLIKNNDKKIKIVVGMSGGVDSSVSAALLKKQGYEAAGVFLLAQNDTEKIQNDTEDVKKVCKKLNISLKIIDARKRFKKEVVGYFLKEYAAGRTPNPCVFCNENFKFKILFETAEKMKADFVATGHYARLCRKITNYKLKIPNELQIKNEKIKTKLLEAKDKNKDQSYFLYRLPQKYLQRMFFPLGEYEKSETRKLAEKFGLPVSAKKESQDVCFLRRGGVSEFLKKNLKMKKGKIVDARGKIIGEHQGLALYTIGQRKNIGIGGAGPFFVAKKDLKNNRLIVANKKEGASLNSRSVVLEKVCWIAESPKFPAKIQIRTRYRNAPVYAIIKKMRIDANKKQANKREYVVEFDKPEKAAAPGQSAVFYGKKGEVLGGGIVR